ncbi:hypothetical protein EVAR_10999_1 [Eumeta japonica]|uniref:Uncharacterized protein n=1 Tax=Eumeta variegata TaxID=151549 RepID=A0A4C1YNB9_EUMVA|nr:hypothetical protein EVAR_10999_1 [Eumeta japonica]
MPPARLRLLLNLMAKVFITPYRRHLFGRAVDSGAGDSVTQLAMAMFIATASIITKIRIYMIGGGSVFKSVTFEPQGSEFDLDPRKIDGMSLVTRGSEYLNNGRRGYNYAVPCIFIKRNAGRHAAPARAPGLMMEPESKHRNSIMNQRILAVFGLVENVCTLTMNDFHGLMMQPEDRH